MPVNHVAMYTLVLVSSIAAHPASGMSWSRRDRNKTGGSMATTTLHATAQKYADANFVVHHHRVKGLSPQRIGANCLLQHEFESATAL
ncbi:hypothetical protein DE146DRAFT_166451 [Phaeosphaeria sp. MPI-PUGE-AT-0046c]|nr:hypothetical protein DE146DRAFT_166451 [Phaeosphaeria sp. MPI-PUGE-AT-0046c]